MVAACAEGSESRVREIAGSSFPWSVEHSTAAAGGGHSEILKFVMMQGAPADASTMEAAARGGHLTCLKNLVSVGCAMGDAIREAREHPMCVAFLKNVRRSVLGHE